MARIEDELVTIPLFRKVPSADLRSTAPLWSEVQVRAGQVLWEEGTTVDELAVVVHGDLGVVSNGVEVGRVLPGEIVGEASAFLAGSLRTATLKARRDTLLLTLAVPGLRALRWQRSPVFEALLDQALAALARRIRATNERIARIAEGGAVVPARVEPSVLARLWKALRPGSPHGDCPPLAPLLARQPVLRATDPEVLNTLSSAFTAEAVDEGAILCLEGEPGDCAWIIASGAIDVLRNVRGNRAELLTTLREGDPFGINTLVERSPRTASCVAQAPTWLYRIDTTGFHGLRGEARLAFRESMLATLATQIKNANAVLARWGTSVQIPPADEASFQKLLRASGYLETLPTSEEALHAMEVVVTADALRNPRRRTLP